MISPSPLRVANSIVRYQSTSPNGSAHCPQASDFIVQRNIILPFCGTLDERLPLVVDGLPHCLCELIRLMQVHEGGLWFASSAGGYEKYLALVGKEGVVSGGVRFGKRVVHVPNDCWWLYHTDICGNPLPGQVE
jgi:hypothetical protein